MKKHQKVNDINRAKELDRLRKLSQVHSKLEIMFQKERQDKNTKEIKNDDDDNMEVDNILEQQMYQK